MKQWLALLAVVVVGTGAAIAQSTDAGNIPFDFLSMRYGAKELSMAGAAIGMPNELAGIYANPAAVGYLTTMQTFVGYRSVILDIAGGVAGISMPTPKLGVWSISVLDRSDGEVKDIQPGPDGQPYATGTTWSANSFSGGLSWAYAFKNNVSVGATAKGFYARMGSDHGEKFSSDGLLLDGGMQYRSKNGALYAGVAFKNVGVLLSGYTHAYDTMNLPSSIGAGVSVVPGYLRSVRLALDIEQAAGEPVRFEPALDIALLQRVLWLRMGYGFSSLDIREMGNILNGTPSASYVKSSWDQFCIGMGFSTAEYGPNLGCDVGFEFRDVDPAFALSLSYSY